MCRSLLTDEFMRVKGSDGSIWAFGDASTIDQPRALQRADELFELADKDKVGIDRHSCVQVVCMRPSLQGGGFIPIILSALQVQIPCEYT